MKDILGQHFGRLTVIAKAPSRNGRSYWLCRCECGNEVIVRGTSLTSGNTKSCGCLHHPDLTGKRFGRLTVLRKTSSGHSTMWLCRCDCGNETVVSTHSLVSGNTKSCGCQRRESAHNTRFKNLTGCHFGKLTVEKLDRIEHGKSYWQCRCNCGNITMVNTSELVTGKTKSCGCLKSREGTNGRLLDGPSKRSKTGIRGVYIEKRVNGGIYYVASLKFKGKRRLHKRFDTLQEAVKARRAAEDKWYKPMIEKWTKEDM